MVHRLDLAYSRDPPLRTVNIDSELPLSCQPQWNIREQVIEQPGEPREPLLKDLQFIHGDPRPAGIFQKSPLLRSSPSPRRAVIQPPLVVETGTPITDLIAGRLRWVLQISTPLRPHGF